MNVLFIIYNPGRPADFFSRFDIFLEEAWIQSHCIYIRYSKTKDQQGRTQLATILVQYLNRFSHV